VGGLVGAGLTVAVWAAVAIFPTSLAPERHPAVAPELAACEEPGGMVERIDAQLAARMSGLGDEDRGRLACALVLEAESARVDPLFVLALIEVESSFDPRALSGRGARGLMQLREATMRREVERAGLAQDDPHDPVANVRAGVRYLRRLLDAFPREDVALMAYNAGPNRILGYLREGGIPQRFRGYPRRVDVELRRLRRSLGQEPAPRLAEAGVARMAE
jgi:hypothetical protein